MLTLIDLAQEVNTIADCLHDDMTEWASAHWKNYLDENGIYIDVEGELEQSYERVFSSDLPDHLYEPLTKHRTIIQAIGVMYDIIREEMNDHQTARRYHAGTMTEMLRERGMSIRDFL